MKINEFVIENRERTDELAPLVIPLIGAIAGGTLTALEINQQYDEYNKMKTAAKAIKDPAKRKVAMQDADNYWDRQVTTGLITAGLGAATGGTAGLALKAAKYGVKGLANISGKMKNWFKGARKPDGSIDPKDAAKMDDVLQKQINDPKFQQQLQKVQQDMPKADTKNISQLPKKDLVANPADRIGAAPTPTKPKGAIGKGVDAVKAQGGKALVGLTTAPGAVSALDTGDDRLKRWEREKIPVRKSKDGTAGQFR